MAMAQDVLYRMVAMEFAYHPVGDALLIWRYKNIAPLTRGCFKPIVQFALT
jgi:hypothetical protein